ncbi:T9SS type A sorting domain-containing protein [Flavobacterium sp. 7A]
MTLSDALGSKTLELTATSSEGTYPISQLKKGIYFIIVENHKPTKLIIQ